MATTQAATASREDIDLIIHANHWDPFQVLGQHETAVDRKAARVVRAFLPDAAKAWVVDLAGGEPGKRAAMERVHPDGFFEAVFPGRAKHFPYRLAVENHEGHSWEFVDPYQFGPVLTDFDLHLLGEGTHYRNFEQLGAHLIDARGLPRRPLRRLGPERPAGQRHRQLQPLGRPPPPDAESRARAGSGRSSSPTSSRARSTSSRSRAGPDGYLVAEVRPLRLRRRAAAQDRLGRLGRHQVRLGRRRVDGRRGRSARASTARSRSTRSTSARGSGSPRTATASSPIASWPTSWSRTSRRPASPTSSCCRSASTRSTGAGAISRSATSPRRRGTARPTTSPTSSTRCTSTAIGVILDWVPAHFPRDLHGLGYFDGTHLYEHEDPRLGEHRDWGTKIFNYGRAEVRNFLFGNALFWLERYHIDGLRVDAVASMLYLDYSREGRRVDPQRLRRQREPRGDRLPQEAQRALPPEHPGILTIAEESTSWSGVSRPTYLGGLGFSLKWNMGWMNDTLVYMSKDPVYRKYEHGALTFSMIYAFNENFMLPLSHDEVVHGKGSLLDKMPGDLWQKFANLRLLYGYMYGHPGKKLLFMGDEIAQWREWNHDESLDWHLLQWRDHQGDPQARQRPERALPVRARAPRGRLRVAGLRVARAARLGEQRPRLPPPGAGPRATSSSSSATSRPSSARTTGSACRAAGFYREILNTDSDIYGGSNVGNEGGVWARPETARRAAVPPLAPTSRRWRPSSSRRRRSRERRTSADPRRTAGSSLRSSRRGRGAAEVFADGGARSLVAIVVRRSRPRARLVGSGSRTSLGDQLVDRHVPLHLADRDDGRLLARVELHDPARAVVAEPRDDDAVARLEPRAGLGDPGVVLGLRAGGRRAAGSAPRGSARPRPGRRGPPAAPPRRPCGASGRSPARAAARPALCCEVAAPAADEVLGQVEPPRDLQGVRLADVADVERGSAAGASRGRTRRPRSRPAGS